jgi:hypothetical protein
MAGIDVHQWKREATWSESLFRQAQDTKRIFTAGKQQDRVAALACYFAQNVDSF